jgi:hypothetical protein
VIFNDYKKRTHDKEETFNKYWFGSWCIALAPSFAFNQQKEISGIQLWTLRDTLPKDVKGVLAQVGKAGFSS